MKWKQALGFRVWCLVIFVAVSCPVIAQRIGDGLWNAGRAFAPVPAQAGKLALQKQLTTVDLYLGFAVVRNQLDIVNPTSDTLHTALDWRDSVTTPHPLLTYIGNTPSLSKMMILDGDTLLPGSTLVLAPGQHQLITYEIAPGQQALLSKEGRAREGNAFVYSLSPSSYSQTGIVQVFVQMKTGLTMSNVWAVEPGDEATVTMSQVKWLPKSAGGDLVIWYEGAAPDQKLEKKLLPARDVLFIAVKDFDLMMFNSPEFKAPPKPDFSTNKQSPLVSALYFIMFSLPWVLLVGFLAWLVFKPKKKRSS